MDNQNCSLLPLEFQKIKEIKKERNKNNNKLIKIEFYQSDSNKSERFYKPISKILNFDKQ